MAARDEELFGKYQLLNRLAMGGMAEIFRAKLVGAAGFAREVVIKRIHPEFSEDDEFVRMFTNEAKWAALLRHPNIVQVLDFDQVDGTYYIAMEYIEGADLKRLQTRGRKGGVPLPFQLALFIVTQALKGLAHAHQFEQDGAPLHIVHRDVSPHNLLISAQGEVKVTDFGIARVMQQSGNTASGVLKGKASYMAPEQTFSSQVDARADLFAMGVVLWELLCRRRLFAANNDLLAIHNVREAAILTPHTCDPSIPEGLSDLVMQALARSADERVHDARGWARQLATYLWLPSPTEELSLYLRQALKGDGVDAAFAKLDEFRAPSLPSLDGLSSPHWKPPPARPGTMPLDSFEEPPKSSPARPGTAQLDGWRPPSAKDPAPESSAGPDEEEESANKGPAFDTTGVAMPTTARGAKGSAQVSSGPTDHDWMIKTESFGAAGAGMVADIYVDDVETPALPDSEFSVVSTVQVNPAGVLAQLPKTPPSDASASSLRGLAYQHDMAETEQVDPAAQLSGLEDDPLAKTQLDPEDSVDMAAQLAAFAASQGLTPTPALSEAETALLNPAQHLPPEALQPPDPEGTMRLHRRDESEEALTTNSKASLVGWIVLIVSVLLVIALFTWIATR